MKIKLDESPFKDNTSQRVQIAKVGIFKHDVYGVFSITLNDLLKMVKHFQANARRQTIDGNPVLPFDYKHEEGDVAAGWIVALCIEKDENGIDALFAVVNWTPKGAEKVRDNEFKFVSPSIRRNYKDAETGEVYDVILKGATLTNVPFLRDMEAVYLLSETDQKKFLPLINQNQKGLNMPTLKEIMAALATMSTEDKSKLAGMLGKKPDDSQATETKKLSEELAKSKESATKAAADLKLSEDTVKGLKEKMEGSTEVSDHLKLAESKVKDLGDKVSSLTKKLAENDKKAEFDLMLSEAKVCEAQRKPFMDNDMAGFAKNFQAIKLNETGSNVEDQESTDAVEKIEKLAEEKMTADKDLTYGNAVSMVLSENSKLREQAG